MPRPNPEIIVNTIPWLQNYYGTVTTGYDSYHQLERSYTNTNSPGYPVVLEWHAHQMHRYVFDPDPGFYYINDRRDVSANNYFEISGGLTRPLTEGFGAFHLGDSDDLMNRAIGKVIDEVKNEAFNLANDLGEYKQTVNMFSSNARRISSAYRALRRGDVKGLQRSISVRPRHSAGLSRHSPKEIARNSGSYWLELQYGWLPLCSDVYAGVTHLHDNLDSKVLRKKASRTLKEVRVDVQPGIGAMAYEMPINTRCRARVILEYKVNRRDLASLNDWGVTNPLDLAWELMPYSFVVDWFLPIGNYLSRLDAFLGLTFLRGSKSMLQDTQVKRRYYAASPEDSGYGWKIGGTDHWHFTDYVRLMLSDFPTVPLPRVKNPISPKHIANAMSLLAQAFLR